MERNWIMTCTKFKIVRELLAKNEKTIDMCKQILTALQACDDEIVARFSDWEWREDFAELWCRDAWDCQRYWIFWKRKSC